MSVPLMLQLVGIDSVPKDISEKYTEEITVALEALKLSSPSLVGSPEDQVDISQWLSFSKQAIDSDSLSKLNNILSTKSYLVGNGLTIADVAVYSKLADLPISTIEININLLRWFDHVQNLVRPTKPLLKFNMTQIPQIQFPLFEIKAEPKTETVDKTPKVEQVKEKVAETKAEDKKSKEKAPAQPKTEEKVPAAESASADLDPSKLDIKVGLVVKCWNHPDSDKLLCEEIDLGEGSTRMIASGIRLHYSAEEVQGKKVLVLANLKERSIAGFKSQGMVLCAVKNNHSEVKLVEPPASAQVGDRVAFPGFTGEPAPPAHMAKKKILESLAPMLRTDASGVAKWNDSAFTIRDEVCTSKLIDATVS